MAFDKKKQKIFDKFIEVVEKKGSKFDFYKTAKAFDTFLEKVGLTIKSNQFFREVWDELNDPQSRWDIDEDALTIFLEAMPKDMIKRNLTDEMIQRKIKPVDQPKYEKLVANFQEATASFLTENNLKSLSPVVITRKGKGQFSVRAFLGDIRDRIGVPSEIQSAIMYRDFYDALEQEIGKNKCKRAVADIVPEVEFELSDWPNMTNLDDAQYEIVFYFEPDEKLVRDVEEAVALTIEGLV